MSRFSVVRAWELDGYRMAVPETLHDEPPPPPDSPEAEAIAELVKETEAAAGAWMNALGEKPLIREPASL